MRLAHEVDLCLCPSPYLLLVVNSEEANTISHWSSPALFAASIAGARFFLRRSATCLQLAPWWHALSGREGSWNHRRSSISALNAVVPKT